VRKCDCYAIIIRFFIKRRRKMQDFIDEERITSLLQEATEPDPQKIRDILAKSRSKERLEPEETAALLQVEEADLLAEMYQLAGEVKNSVYGKRIVFFAPLYVGNRCINNCIYCGFRRTNEAVQRKTLSLGELETEVRTLINQGQKRLILVFGEHPAYDADFICQCIEKVYSTKDGRGEIRRVNINAAPMEVAEYRQLHETGIGTFQIFQETYDRKTYAAVHPAGDKKSDFQWRLYGLDRAMEAGIDDVGIGALFGLYDWKFEVMGLLYHAIHLEERYGVGPHTISVPRIEPAINTPFASVRENRKYHVSDEEFKRVVAVIRLSVPYTGLILTAREPATVRRELIPLGVTQIDAGSRIGIGGYQKSAGGYLPEKEQFQLGDVRSLDEVIAEICELGYIPSFCTAGYRCGRTGEDFMALARPGLVRKFCMPNAILTFKEYLLDYAAEKTRAAGEEAIKKTLAEMGKDDPLRKKMVDEKLREIEGGKRDVYV
jgi:2-iminoacetate synthase